MPNGIAKILCVLTLLCWAPVASAQITVDPVQQCIWRCLAEHGNNAGSYAYNACVESRCSARQPGSNWVARRMNPSDPPYINGFSVNAVTYDTGLRIFYVCGFDGASYINFESPSLTRRYNLNAVVTRSWRLLVFVDNERRYLIETSPFEGTLSGTVHPQSPLLSDLATARSATVWAEDRHMLGTLPLANIDALARAGEACAKG